MKDTPVYYPEMRQIAVFLDIDNLPQYANTNIISILLQSLKPWGKVVIRRAYGAALSQKSYIYQEFLQNKFEIAEVSSSTAHRRNGTDIRIALEIMELLHSHSGISIFVIASGDGDFLEVVHRLHEYQRFVIGVGSEKSSSYELTRNCDVFLYYEKLLESSRLPQYNREITTCSTSLKSTPEGMRAILRKLSLCPPDPSGRRKILKKLAKISPSFPPTTTFYDMQEKLVQECASEGISKSSVRHTLYPLVKAGIFAKQNEQPIGPIPEVSEMEKVICQLQLQYLLTSSNVVADPVALSEVIWGEPGHATEIEKILLKEENSHAIPSPNCIS